MRTLCESDGLTVLWATHLIEEVRQDDRVLILHEGKLLADGTGDRHSVPARDRRVQTSTDQDTCNLQACLTVL